MSDAACVESIDGLKPVVICAADRDALAISLIPRKRFYQCVDTWILSRHVDIEGAKIFCYSLPHLFVRLGDLPDPAPVMIADLPSTEKGAVAVLSVIV